jgi:uncharacterized protein (TIGR02588 family)
MTTGKHKSSPRNAPTPLLEWVLGGIGVVLVIACVGFLVYQGMNGDERPGKIVATVTDIVSAEDEHIVMFELRNGGSQTLSNVRVTGRLTEGDEELERAQTIIDYLPGHSRQGGGFYFKNDPRAHLVEIRAEGYQEP